MSEENIIVTQPEKLFGAFAKAQGKFRTPKLNRTAEVKKDGKLLYKTLYADLQECIDCIRAPLAENGLSFVQLTILRGDDDWTLVLKLMHSSGEFMETDLPLNVNQTNQQLGGTLTYLKRYQMSAFFGLAADFDDDGNATESNQVEFNKPKGSPAANPKVDQGNPMVNIPLLQKMYANAKVCGWTEEQVKSFLELKFGIASSKELTLNEWKMVMNLFENKHSFEKAMELEI